jgi:hypothetical protein
LEGFSALATVVLPYPARPPSSDNTRSLISDKNSFWGESNIREPELDVKISESIPVSHFLLDKDSRDYLKLHGNHVKEVILLLFEKGACDEGF